MPNNECFRIKTVEFLSVVIPGLIVTVGRRVLSLVLADHSKYT